MHFHHRLLIVAALCALTSCDPSTPDEKAGWEEACGNVACGAGRCVLDGTEPRCLCSDGFREEGLSCVPEGEFDPCSSNPCRTFGRTVCVADGLTARCECDPGRELYQDQCVPESACTPNPCTAAFQTVCEDVGGTAVCTCDLGHEPVGDGCSPIPLWDCNAVHGGDAHEPNECPASATLLPTLGPGPAGNTLSPEGDVDWFQLEAEGGRIYEVIAEGAEGLLLYADAWGIEARKALAADHRGSSRVVLRFKAERSGPHFVRIRALRSSDMGVYTITAHDRGVDDYADTPFTSFGLSSGTTIPGALQFYADADVFKLGVTGGRKYSIQITSKGSGGITVELIAADGNTVLQRSTGASITLVTRPATNMTQYLRITGDEPTSLEPYEVTTLSLGADDHGDVPAEATPLVLPATRSVSIETEDDVDMLKFPVTAGRIYTVSCTPVGGYQDSVSVALLDQDGRIVAQTSGSTSGSQIGWEAEADGTLFAQVRRYWGGSQPLNYSCTARDFGLDDHGDSISDATPIPAATSVAGGFIETAGDVDAFSFTAQANHVYSISCSFGGGSSNGCALALFAPGGGQVGSATGLLAYEVKSAGTYVVEVGGSWSASGAYTLTVTDLGVDDHGDSITDATTLVPGSPIALGTLESSADKDVFAFTATASHIYRFTCSNSSGSGSACSVRLLNAVGVVVASGGGGTANALSYEIPTAGTWYFEVTPYWSSSSGPIAYTYVLEDLGTDDQGDNFATATPITVGDSGSGTFEWPGDVDAYTFTVTSGHIYRVTCTPALSVGCSIVLKTSAGVTLAQLSGYSSSATNLYWEADAPRTIVAELKAGSGSGSLPGGYMWTVTDLGTDDHGDVFAEGTPLILPMTTGAAGKLDLPGDLDVFTFEATAGQIYTATCTALPPSNGCSLRVLGANGIIVSGTSGNPVGFEAATTGTYAIEVRSTYSGDMVSYTLTVQDSGTDDHGDTSASATPLTLGGAPVTGANEYAGDVDVFSFNATAGHIHRVTCTSGGPSTCSFSVKNGAGSSLSSGYGTAYFKAQVSGLVYVHVQNAGAQYSVTAEDLGVDDHGDSTVTATPIASLPANITGVLESPNDRDYFSVNLVGGQQYTITGTSTGLIDLRIDAPNGASLVWGSPPRTFTAPTTGTYYLLVEGWTTTSVGAYTLTFQ